MLDPNCWAAWWHLQLLEHSPATLPPWPFGRRALYVLKMIFRPQCRQKKLFMLLKSLHILTLLNNSIFLQSRRWPDNCFLLPKMLCWEDVWSGHTLARWYWGQRLRIIWQTFQIVILFRLTTIYHDRVFHGTRNGSVKICIRQESDILCCLSSSASLTISSKAPNEPSQRLQIYNHGEGPFYTLYHLRN